MDSVAGAFNWVGGNLSGMGRAIEHAGGWAQEHVSATVHAGVEAVDGALDTFEHSSVGDNTVGRGMGSAASGLAHFTGGVVTGVARMGTGVVGIGGTVVRATGGAVQYASNPDYRNDVNTDFSRLATNVAQNPTAIPNAIGRSVAEAWRRDPADLLGQALPLVLTAGTGAVQAARVVREGTALASEAASTTVGETGALATTETTTAGAATTTGEIVASDATAAATSTGGSVAAAGTDVTAAAPGPFNAMWMNQAINDQVQVRRVQQEIDLSFRMQEMQHSQLIQNFQASTRSAAQTLFLNQNPGHTGPIPPQIYLQSDAQFGLPPSLSYFQMERQMI